METFPQGQQTPDSTKSISESQRPPKSDKIDYQGKNRDHISKIKQKKQKQQEDKQRQLKREQELKDKLKKKVLLEAQIVREQKQKENSKVKNEEQPVLVVQKPKRVICGSLPKAPQDNDKQKFKKRHSQFLNSLTQGIKSKKQSEQAEKKRKQQQREKLREELGINKISSKLNQIMAQQSSKKLIRSSSADKLEDKQKQQQEIQNQPYSVTSKNFQTKHMEYIQNIKRKKLQKQQKKEQEQKKIKQRKQKLKEYVMTTVKKNVLEGVYDDQDDKKKNTKRRPSILGTADNQEIQEEDDEESGGQQDNDEQKPVKKRRKMRNFPHVVDVVQWRKKNRLQPDTQVFIVTGGYGGIKKALYARGWVQNPDPTSPCFNLKWVLQSKQCDYNSLQQNQIVNHFQKNGAITTKIGLSKNLRGVRWVTNVDLDDFFPKCYDLCDEQDLVAFQDEFKLCKAMTVLKLYMKLISLKNTNQIQNIKQRVKIAYDILSRNIIQLDDLIDKKKVQQLISKKEWEVLAEDQLNTQGLAKKKHEQWLMSINLKFNDNKQKKKKTKKVKKNKQVTNQPEQQKQEQGEEVDQFTKQINQLLTKYQQKYPQFNLTNTHNIWILKPAGLSRGRGITCYNNLVQIQDHIKSKQSQWIAQKYIQNPLIVCKRKFDIRLWVLVTSFNPLIVWKYDECYIRFSALDYNVDDVGNKFIHLTNNSIASLHKNFDKSEIKGNMYSQEQFSNYLQEKEGYNVFEQKIRGQMTDIIKWSMMAGQQHIQHRKNSHQLYGYDFMIDEDYKVWLIEINSSPSMDFSTHITTRLVKSCLEDVIKVIVDYAEAPKKERKKVDTGGFKLIYKGTQIPDKHITTGLNLGIQGIQLKKSTKRVPAKQNIMDNFNKPI